MRHIGNQKQKRIFARQRGFTLLLAILVTGITLAIGLSILNITLKEYLLSGIARESYAALNAADAGMECALYWDTSTSGDVFDVGAGTSAISCMGNDVSVDGTAVSGITTNDISLEWGTPAVCAEVTVNKYFSASEILDMGDGRNCPIGNECTKVISRGYNKACDDLDSDRTVERALKAVY